MGPGSRRLPLGIPTGTLREALEPFAKIADDYDAAEAQRREYYKDEGRPAGPGLPDHHRVSIGLGECRRARAALRATVPESEPVADSAAAPTKIVRFLREQVTEQMDQPPGDQNLAELRILSNIADQIERGDWK